MRRCQALTAAVCSVGLLLASCGGDATTDDRAADESDGGEGLVDGTSVDDGTAADGTTIDVSSGTVIDTTVPAGDTAEGWTVLVYSIADTDLEPFLLDDVTEMGGVGSGPGVNIVALVDRASDYSADPVLGLDDWQGAKLLQIEPGGATELADLGDVDTGDPQLLADFIATGISEFPAAHYSLIISDHGASWPGVGGDESSDGNGLGLDELQAGIAGGLEGAGVDQLDLLGFDACLMATYEVASALAPLAHRMVASQELEPGHGWDYGVLQMLNDDPSTDVDALGAALIDGFESQATDEETAADITLALIDLDQMPALDAAMADFAGALAERAAALGPVIGRTRASTLSFGRSPDPSSDSNMVDLGMLVSEIGVDALDVSDLADQVIRSLNDLVLDRVNGVATQGSTGLSIYFPADDEWFDQDYTAVSSAGAWTGFLQAYYAGGDAIPADEIPTVLDDTVDASFTDDGIEVTGLFDPVALENVANATIEYGIVGDDGSVTYFGSEPADVSTDGSGAVSGFYDLTALTMTDGIDTAYAYLDLYHDDASGVTNIDVPLAYYPPGEDTEYDDVILSLVLDGSGDIVSETYYVYDPDTETYGELTADPDGIIVPYVELFGADGSDEWVPTSDVGLYADLPGIAYDLEPLASGTQLWVELNVTDFGGNTASVGGVVTIP